MVRGSERMPVGKLNKRSFHLFTHQSYRDPQHDHTTSLWFSVVRAQSLFLALGALVRPGVNFWAHCRNLRRSVKNFRRTASSTWSINSKIIVTLQKERLWIHVTIWAYSSSIEHNENKYKNQNIHTRVKLRY